MERVCSVTLKHACRLAVRYSGCLLEEAQPFGPEALPIFHMAPAVRSSRRQRCTTLCTCSFEASLTCSLRFPGRVSASHKVNRPFFDRLTLFLHGFIRSP